MPLIGRKVRLLWEDMTEIAEEVIFMLIQEDK